MSAHHAREERSGVPEFPHQYAHAREEQPEFRKLSDARGQGELMADDRRLDRLNQFGAETPARTRWQPGMPVTTAQDHAEWMAWRHDRVLTLQKDRRKRMRRIDYYPSKEVAALIESQRTPRCGGDASSILNRIVSEWAARQRHSGIE
jgi:hypothetical protein